MLRYVRKRFDSLAIVTVLGKIAVAENMSVMTDSDQAILAALRRSRNDLSHADPREIQEYLTNLEEEQVPGLVSNVKGILHEMEFVRLENEDGDDIYASFFKDTNHPETDVQITNQLSGESWSVQLKATDDSYYVKSGLTSILEEKFLLLMNWLAKWGFQPLVWKMKS